MDKIKLSDIRAKFPMYADVPDAQLLAALHKQFYSDMPRGDFLQAIDFDTSRQDPTKDMSTAERVLAGIGSGMTGVGRAVGLGGFIGDHGLPSNKEDAEANDAALKATTAGKVGSALGQVALAAPAALIPGANTYMGAALIGGGTGALFTEGDAADRAKAAAFGALGGAAGKGAGDLLGWGVPKLVNSMAGTRAVAQAANAQRDAAALAAQQAGYVLPPADVRGGLLNEALGGLSGKIKTAQVASQRNQGVTNDLARQALGLPQGSPLTADALQTLRTQAGTQGYAPVRGAGTVTADSGYTQALDDIASQYQGAARSFPGAAKNPVMDMVEGLRGQPGAVGPARQTFDAGDALDMIKVLRETADKAYRGGDTGLGKASKAAAGALEDQLDRYLAATGNSSAISAFKAARELIAKTYSVQKALNSETGDVSAQALAQQLGRGKPLSGDLEKIAQIGTAFPKATQALKETPKAVSPLDYAAGLFSAGATGPAGALAVAARPGVRSMLLSKPYQGLLGSPSTYQAGMLEQLLPGLQNETLLRSLPITGGLLSADFSQ